MGIKAHKTQRRAKSEILFYIYIWLCKSLYLIYNNFYFLIYKRSVLASKSRRYKDLRAFWKCLNSVLSKRLMPGRRILTPFCAFILQGRTQKASDIKVRLGGILFE